MKSKLALFATTCLLFTLFALPLGHMKQVDAGCVCRFQPGYPDSVDGVIVGYLENINDGGRSCEEVFGAGKTGLSAPPTTPFTDLSDASSCDVNKSTLDVGWQIPTFSQLIGNVIRLLFFIAGLFALVYLLLGGFEWVRSAGEEKPLEAARSKITNAVIGLVVMIAVLSLVIFLEQVVFGGKICLGISCPMNIGFLQLIR